MSLEEQTKSCSFVSSCYKINSSYCLFQHIQMNVTESRWFWTSAEYSVFGLYYSECKNYVPQIYNVLLHDS